MSRLPLVVIVSGAPGSGKTTLASKLAHYLNIPHIERDKISGGLEYTLGKRVDRVKQTIPTYYSMLSSMIESGMSFVTDGTLYKGVSEKDIERYISKSAFTVNVHARATNEKERFIERERVREGRSNDWVERHLKKLDEIYEDTVHPLHLGAPLIEVDANNEYKPSLAGIAREIEKLHQVT
jgi:adenylate kinase family enzyme